MKQHLLIIVVVVAAVVATIVGANMLKTMYEQKTGASNHVIKLLY